MVTDACTFNSTFIFTARYLDIVASDSFVAIEGKIIGKLLKKMSKSVLMSYDHVYRLVLNVFLIFAYLMKPVFESLSQLFLLTENITISLTGHLTYTYH